MNSQWDHQPSADIVQAQLGKMAEECGFKSLNDMKYTTLGMRAKIAGSTIMEVLRGDHERNLRALSRAASLDAKM